jgi:hypothetical protein
MSKAKELPFCSFCGSALDTVKKMIQSQLDGNKPAMICDVCIKAIKARIEIEKGAKV